MKPVRSKKTNTDYLSYPLHYSEQKISTKFQVFTAVLCWLLGYVSLYVLQDHSAAIFSHAVQDKNTTILQNVRKCLAKDTV